MGGTFREGISFLFDLLLQVYPRDTKINHSICFFQLTHLFCSSVTNFHTNCGKLSGDSLAMQKLNLHSCYNNIKNCLGNETI